MLAADKLLMQSQIKQNAVALREKELKLHYENFNAVGTQAAVLAGFAMTALAEVTVPPSCSMLEPNSPLRAYTMDSPQCTSIWLKGAFYMFVLLCMAAQIHCVCNTTFITVWGAGLALRGPDGSMMAACDGMVAERKQVFMSFGIGLVAFLCSAIALSWIIMPPVFAFMGTCVLCGSMLIIKQYLFRPNHSNLEKNTRNVPTLRSP